MSTLIEIKNLSVDFPMGKTKGKKNYLSAVSDATLSIQKGDMFGIVGESGCGKSTLINAILGFCDITSGTISVMGNELSNKTAKSVLREARKHMQVVFQNPYTSLNPRLEVHEIVAEPLLISGVKDKKVLFDSALEMLIKVGMTEQDAKRNIFEFSGGQRQRIAIARALITKPDILMLDEPVSALDLSVHAQICNLLLDLKEEYNLTYVFVSHNLSLIKHICNKTCVMYLGQIVELGDSKKIFKNPHHPYTKALLSSVLDIHSAPKTSTLEGELSSPINIGKECRFYARCNYKCDQCKQRNIVLEQVADNHLCACVIKN
ncbi:MAG: ABC transporter ATP-binding protein [Bacillota bacterium]